MVNHAERSRTLSRAEALARVGRLRSCAARCEALLASDPRDIEALALLAWARLEAGDAREGATIAREWLALAPTSLAARRMLGRALLRLHETDEAIEHLRHCAASGDLEDRARLARALSLDDRTASQRAEARSIVHACLSATLRDARVVHQLLRAALALDAHSSIVSLSELLLSIEPNDARYRASVARAHLQLRRPLAARMHAIAAIEREPNLTLPWLVRASACAQLGLDQERRASLDAARRASEAMRVLR
jgi:tetratricopeptide (TPR) repeat protein